MVPVLAGIKPFLNIYPSTKYGLTALVQVLRHELNYAKNTKVRVSNISPGAVKTETLASIDGEVNLTALNMPSLEPEDVADAVLYMLSTPGRVQIQDLIIGPTGI